LLAGKKGLRKGLEEGSGGDSKRRNGVRGKELDEEGQGRSKKQWFLKRTDQVGVSGERGGLLEND